MIIDEDEAKTYFSISVGLRFATGFAFGLASGWMANKFGRRKALIYSQLFCILGALASGTARLYVIN